MPSETPDDREENIRVTSATGRYSTTIVHGAMSLITGIGTRDDDQSVLVPFVECEIAIDRKDDGDIPEEERVLEEHSIMITLENAAFLAEAFSSEFAKLGPDLVSLSQGTLKPVPDRIAYAIERLQQTKNNITLLTDVLGKFSAQLGS